MPMFPASFNQLLNINCCQKIFPLFDKAILLFLRVFFHSNYKSWQSNFCLQSLAYTTHSTNNNVNNNCTPCAYKSSVAGYLVSHQDCYHTGSCGDVNRKQAELGVPHSEIQVELD